jgi:hypothetical protein
VSANFGGILRKKEKIISELIKRRERGVYHANLGEQGTRDDLRQRVFVEVPLPSVSGGENVATLHLQCLPVTTSEVGAERRMHVNGRIEPDEIGGAWAIEVEVRRELEFEFGSVNGALDDLSIGATEREVERRYFREVRHRGGITRKVQVMGEDVERWSRNTVGFSEFFENDPERAENS